jgi:hypothetical protein
VDARRDPIANRIIHKPVTGKPVFALEGRGNDQHVKVPTSGLGAFMTMMLGAVIPNSQGLDGQGSA